MNKFERFLIKNISVIFFCVPFMIALVPWIVFYESYTKGFMSSVDFYNKTAVLVILCIIFGSIFVKLIKVVKKGN
jgi:hypothetical protein